MPNDKKKPPARVAYGDSGFKGLGVIKCHACGDPLRDHELIGPCPKLGGRQVRLTAPKRLSRWEMEEKKKK